MGGRELNVLKFLFCFYIVNEVILLCKFFNLEKMIFWVVKVGFDLFLKERNLYRNKIIIMF